MTQGRRILVWAILAVLAALVTYTSFRGYMSSEMLFNFGNLFYC